MNTGTRADINNMICGTDCVFVMFHDDNSISQVSQLTKCFKQAVIVPLMKADRRLIKNIQYPRQTGSDLGGKTNTLTFPAREGPGCTGKTKIIETYRIQEMQAVPNFFQNTDSNFFLFFGEGRVDIPEPFISITNGFDGYF